MPEILNHATELDLAGLNKAKAIELKLAGNKDNDLYKLILVAQCNALSSAMPFLFERIDDETELLLPDNLLLTDSVIAKLVADIPEEDWAEVEIIGWLYQFYISEKKDEVIGKVVKSEDIPAATQLFTPNWIVQYLVQNSVGRLWMMANPSSTLKSQWPYYIEPAEQTPEVQAQLNGLIQTRMDEDGGSLNPETITVLDPACGSGHILVVAYDVLKAIYLERGYQPRAIPRLILEKNLYGLDIDDRAAQMAGFALLMKARADDRRLFDSQLKLNVLSLQESKDLSVEELATHLASFKVQRSTIASLVETFEHAKTFGSLIQISNALKTHLAMLLEVLALAKQSGDMYTTSAADDLLPLVQQAQILAMQFDAVVANPPYMGGKYLTPLLKKYLKDNYDGFEKDLFSAFMIRNLALSNESGQLGFMSPFVWMFISSYEDLRQHFIDNTTLTSLVQLEYSGFEGATVPICTFTLAKSHVSNFTGSYIRLSDFRGADQQGPKTLEAIQNNSCGWFYTAKPDDFNKIPGSPIAYWSGKGILDAFENLPKVSEKFDVRTGMQTGDNSRFVRLWPEVNFFEINKPAQSYPVQPQKWFLYSKGGEYRKWYGNVDHVVYWDNDGQDIKNCYVNGSLRSRVREMSNYFLPAASWSFISSSYFGCRFKDAGIFFDVAGSCALQREHKIEEVLAFFCSCVASNFLRTLNPTLNFQIQDISNLPLTSNARSTEIAAQAIEIAKSDWDDSESSFGFSSFNLLQFKFNGLLQESFERWSEANASKLSLLKSLEEENNRIFIDAYGLQDELTPDVPESQITLARADREKDCQRLISYAIGCMMGRYSLDEPGLIYAHAGNVGFDPSRYNTFPADVDGIVPITDTLWFEDDAAKRICEFILAVWGVDDLDENIAWLAESLGNKGNETPEETIRRYLASSFYKNHLQTYKKRPIYWLFSSGKQGAFQALVYLHRYNEGTLARMRSEYVVPLTGKILSRIEMLEKDAVSETSTAARTKINKEIEVLRKQHIELLAYDEKLRHYADMRIQLNLDDGVKVNYGKFGDLLAEVKAVTGGASDE
jgi:type II restriction/modification system DNA methylase subunit YeeA